MKIAPRLLLILALAALAPPLVAQETTPAPIVRARLLTEPPILVSQPAELALEVLVPTFLRGAPGFPDELGVPDAVVLLRPGQITAGAMVLACKEQAERLPDVSAAAYAELPRVTADLEAALAASFVPDKINYILLMMVDRYVHWHVVPRWVGDTNFLSVLADVRSAPEHLRRTHERILAHW